MTSYGYFLACEEFTPGQLLEQARRAADTGFTRLAISDHFHPWNDAQGNSPLVWSMIGALSQAVHLPVTTLVTCPTMRLHPAITAQAAATPKARRPRRLRTLREPRPDPPAPPGSHRPAGRRAVFRGGRQAAPAGQPALRR